jgi:hypothetical protein
MRRWKIEVSPKTASDGRCESAARAIRRSIEFLEPKGWRTKRGAEAYIRNVASKTSVGQFCVFNVVRAS